MPGRLHVSSQLRERRDRVKIAYLDLTHAAVAFGAAFLAGAWPNFNASCGGALSATPARTTQARRIRPGLIVKPAKLLRIDSIGCLGVVTDPIRARFPIRSEEHTSEL